MAGPRGPRLRRPATLDHLKKKEPLEQRIPVVLANEPSETVQDARQALLRAETHLAEQEEGSEAEAEAQRAVDEANNALEDALDEQNEHVVWIRLRSCGRRAYDDLVTEHPPSEDQILKAKERDDEAVFNMETFAPALVAACAVEPVMSVEDAREIFETWNVSESMPLFMAAMSVCTGRRVAELGNVFGGTRG